MEASSDAFARALVERVCEARRTLRAAAESTDRFAVAGALDALERALLLARENGVDVPDGAGDGGQVES